MVFRQFTQSLFNSVANPVDDSIAKEYGNYDKADLDGAFNGSLL